MTVVLADDLLAVEFPQPSVVVRARRDEVSRVGAEGAVPDPALVARQGGLQGKRFRVAVVVYLGRLF